MDASEENKSSTQQIADDTSISHVMAIDTESHDTTMQNNNTQEPSSLPLTHALEALLGGLEPLVEQGPVPASAPVPRNLEENSLPVPTAVEQIAPVADILEMVSKEEDVTMASEPKQPLAAPAADTVVGDTPMEQNVVGGIEQAQTELAQHKLKNTPSTTSNEDTPRILGLESLVYKPEIKTMVEDTKMEHDGHEHAEVHTVRETSSAQPTSVEIASQNPESVPRPAASEELGEPAPEVVENPEWEVDSSPIESSSDDSSDDSSSEEESEDGDNTYKLLSPEEQARILMEGDGGSDDEGGGGKAKGSGGQLRTKNEVPEVIIPKPDVIISPEMPIQELGYVDKIVESIVLINGKTSGEYRVPDSGSVLCLEDRSVIGVVGEPLGPVQHPLYSIYFTNAGEITAAGLSLGTKVFYSEQHSTYVFTQALKAYKGSDASNLHDEEVGDDEMEFSDDEAEAEYKRKVKQKKAERHNRKTGQNGGSSRGGHPLQQSHRPNDGSQGMNYDDEEDGPYKPLARPAGFADNTDRPEPPQEGQYASPPADRHPSRDFGNMRGRGKGDRGRGDRGRGRGDRGRGRGGFQDRRDNNSGYAQAPQSYSQPQSHNQFPPPYQQHSPTGGFPNPATNLAAFFTPQPQSQYPQQPQLPQMPQMPWPQFPASFPPPFPNMQNGWPNMSAPLPNMPNLGQGRGAFINPAFFQNNQPGNTKQWNQQGQNGNGDGSGHGNGNGSSGK